MDGADLAYAGVAEQARLIAAGELSSRELTETLLERIDRIDPKLNSFRLVMADEALAEADDRDRRRRRREQAPMLGVPVAIKDENDVAGTTTTYGTGAAETPAARDGATTRRLREAGAVIIGKTNMPEFGQWPFTESETFGITRNPGTPRGRRAARAAAPALRSRPASCPPASVATAAARSGSPPPAAACSGSSPSAAGSAPTRNLSSGAHSARPGRSPAA